MKSSRTPELGQLSKSNGGDPLARACLFISTAIMKTNLDDEILPPLGQICTADKVAAAVKRTRRAGERASLMAPVGRPATPGISLERLKTGIA
jgi:hypothetical protein